MQKLLCALPDGVSVIAGVPFSSCCCRSDLLYLFSSGEHTTREDGYGGDDDDDIFEDGVVNFMNEWTKKKAKNGQ